MDVVLPPLLKLIITVIDLYVWMVVIAVILSWLTALKVVNISNRFVALLAEFVYRVTEPALGPIRRLIPNLGGFDISPVLLIFALVFLRDVLINLAVRID